jgi:hypothetical protein
LNNRIYDVVHATGEDVGVDDDECPLVSGVGAEDIVVTMCDKCILGRFSLVAAAAPVLRPHDCK